MNKKTVSKVNLFFGGLVSRMEENKDFFNDITINLKSGTKNFPAKILYTDDITLDYQAVKRNVEKDGLWDIIAEELLKYDEAQIIYSERGAKIVIDANDKKVNMRHEDVTKDINKTSVVQTGREYVVNPALAKDLLEEIGILAKNGKIKNDKIRKYNQIDYFDDVPVTCIDMAMPVVIIPAEYLGKTGYELPAELDADKALLARIESIRLQAGKAMGLGDVSNMVIPKPVLISPAQKGGAINVRYFMPHSCHRALAITGAIAISSSCALEGTVTRQIVPSVGYGNINIEHPSGALDVHLSNEGQDATTLRASVIRTTRKIFSGEVYLP